MTKEQHKQLMDKLEEIKQAITPKVVYVPQPYPIYPHQLYPTYFYPSWQGPQQYWNGVISQPNISTGAARTNGGLGQNSTSLAQYDPSIPRTLT